MPHYYLMTARGKYSYTWGSLGKHNLCFYLENFLDNTVREKSALNISKSHFYDYGYGEVPLRAPRKLICFIYTPCRAYSIDFPPGLFSIASRIVP